ncbi:MAG: hypothetical protein U0527_09195 [Candidatus Eisenbacteria bacterium]
MKLGVGEISAANVDGNVDLLAYSGQDRRQRPQGRRQAGHRERRGRGERRGRQPLGRHRIGKRAGERGEGPARFDRHRIGQRDRGADIDCEDFSIDTGSACRSRLRDDDAKFDTGSGSIEVSFERVGAGNFVFDTGSGGIDVLLPEQISADIEAETGAGNIKVDVHRPQDVEKHDSSVRFTLGSGRPHEDR